MDKIVEIDFKEYLEKHKGSILEGIQEGIKDRVNDAMRYQSQEALTDAIKVFYEDEILPEVLKHLRERKDELIDDCMKSVSDVLALLGQHMVERASKNMDSYNSEKVIKALFGIY